MVHKIIGPEERPGPFCAKELGHFKDEKHVGCYPMHVRQGWCQGRARKLWSPLEHASPSSKDEKLFSRKFMAFIVP